MPFLSKIKFVCFLGVFVSGCTTLLSPPRVEEARYTNYEDNPEGVRKRILVLPFLNLSPHSSEKIADTSRQTLLRELLKSNQALVVQNSDLPQDPQTYLKNSQYDLDAVSQAAAPMGVTSVIEGKILEIKARRKGAPIGLIRTINAYLEARVQLRVYSSRTRKEVLNASPQVSMEASTTQVMGLGGEEPTQLVTDPELIRSVVQKAFQAVMPQVLQTLDKISWEGRIAMVQGERVYVNAGQLSGLRIGDLLKVTDLAKEIFDPESGSYLGQVPGRMKGTVEVISFFGRDGAVAIVYSGAGFKENDRVELY